MMWRMLFVAAGLLLGAEPADKDAAQKEMDRFNGTWQAVSVERDGKETPKE
jgi:hypothetical protein